MAPHPNGKQRRESKRGSTRRAPVDDRRGWWPCVREPWWYGVHARQIIASQRRCVITSGYLFFLSQALFLINPHSQRSSCPVAPRALISSLSVVG